MGPKAQKQTALGDDSIKLWRWVFLWALAAFIVATVVITIALPMLDSLSLERSVKAVWHAQKLNTATNPLDTRSEIHSLLLSHQIYIPIDDILVNSKAKKMAIGKVFPVQEHCGNGIIYIWVPLEVHIPLAGAWTFERCFALKARDTT